MSSESKEYISILCNRINCIAQCINYKDAISSEILINLANEIIFNLQIAVEDLKYEK